MAPIITTLTSIAIAAAVYKYVPMLQPPRGSGVLFDLLGMLSALAGGGLAHYQFAQKSADDWRAWWKGYSRWIMWGAVSCVIATTVYCLLLEFIATPAIWQLLVELAIYLVAISTATYFVYVLSKTLSITAFRVAG